jgi:hypothetical protein
MKNPPLSQWQLMIEAARWRAAERGTAHQSVRCAICHESFIAGRDGSPTYIEEHGAVLIRVCTKCEPTLTVIP